MSMGLLGCAYIDNTKLIVKKKSCRCDLWSTYVVEACLVDFVDDIVYGVRGTFSKKLKCCEFIDVLVWWENSNILGLVWCYVESISDPKRELLEVDFHEIVNHSVCDSDC